ncbi:2-polyprenyl-6-methoxyphenol hydroxylase [Aureobasidium sp. EXF-3400]|nr:2-polyprenyl-6-methoxyphenol hydroxylase [Aureobasidium sp. EXF-12344]KAI4773531.1 2-polyprenyl-6-methoxyphenol hydroxylase [Aureobasidium sp. EXF-3400]
MDFIETEVVICGSGSAGICAAIWLAQAGISFRFLETMDGPLEIGQADGVACRTVEIFESFGISEELLREAYHVNELTFWSMRDQKLCRTGRAPDTPPGLSHLPHVILNQARINELLLHKMYSYNPNQHIDYAHHVNAVQIDLTKDYPVGITASNCGQEKIFRAKYALACDGAHSSVRRSLGYKMVGDSSNAIWGVMDIFPRTNFPDIRKKATVHSKNGSIVVIPREGGFMVRFYVQMPAGTDPKQVTIAGLHQRAASILEGYEFEVQHTFWWSAYSIGQRLAEKFSAHDRVFLAGDACHTHSPKAGQGMNVSLQDGYNIGWKLAHVLRGRLRPDAIGTYVSERSKVAAELIDFDRTLTSLYNPTHAGSAAETFQDHFLRSAKYMAGLMTRYEGSILVNSQDSDQQSARNVHIGMRFPSARVVRLSDSMHLEFARVLKSDGRWRIVIFVGDIKEPAGKERLDIVTNYLNSTGSPLMRRSTSGVNLDSNIELLLLLAGHQNDIEVFRDIPALYLPIHTKYNMADINNVFIDDESITGGHGQAYGSYGVDKDHGCVVVIRPDQYVSMVTSIPNVSKIGRFFDKITPEDDE